MLLHVNSRTPSPVVDSVSIQVKHARPQAHLTKARESVDKRTGSVLETGYLGNLYVRLYPGGVLRVKGSLPAFLKGSNLRTLKRSGVEEAVTKLSDALGFDPDSARVFQVDLAATVSMPRPVAEYLPLLGSAPRFKRVTFGAETVSFRNGPRWLTFYDKGREAGVAGHLLRFEVKYLERLKDVFGQAVVLTDLYDEAFFALMVRQWQEAYALVRKLRRPVLSPVTTPRQLERELSRLGLQAAGGEQAVIGMVDAWSLGRRVYPLRRCIRELAGGGASQADAKLIEELDEAIERAARQPFNNSTIRPPFPPWWKAYKTG